MKGIEGCIPEWTREVATYHNGELSKKRLGYAVGYLYAKNDHARKTCLAWLKILNAETAKRANLCLKSPLV